MKLLTVPVIAFFAAALSAQQPDLAAAQRELDHMFDRPAGTIQQEQKDKLGAFLKRFEGQDLQQLGYAKALHLYLERDYDGATVALDAFFARYDTIANEEHRTMAGRIFLNAVATEARAAEADMQKLARWGEGMTRLYHDTAMLERMANGLVSRVPDPAAFRVALAQGVFGSDLPTAQKDAFLRSLYAGGAAGGASDARAVPAARIRPAPADARPPIDESKVVQVGQEVETFAADVVLNGPAKFDLADYRGKVVVLDFFATWCGPCRRAVPSMVALQKEHPDDVRVVGVTRFYTYGTDFSGENVELPNGGKLVRNLDQDQEVAVNDAFIKAFELNYPLVFASGENLARERFGVTGIPTMFVIGRDGKLVGKTVGANSHEKLLELVEQARK